MIETTHSTANPGVETVDIQDNMGANISTKQKNGIEAVENLTLHEEAGPAAGADGARFYERPVLATSSTAPSVTDAHSETAIYRAAPAAAIQSPSITALQRASSAATPTVDPETGMTLFRIQHICPCNLNGHTCQLPRRCKYVHDRICTKNVSHLPFLSFWWIVIGRALSVSRTAHAMVNCIYQPLAIPSAIVPSVSSEDSGIVGLDMMHRVRWRG